MKQYPYRKGVNAVVTDGKGNFLIVQKSNYKDNEWDFPGGGVEESEDPTQAILRELEEELGSTDFKIIKKSPYKNRFDWPLESQQRGFNKHGKWWRGQEKIQFIVEYNGDKKDIALQEEEIKKSKWVSFSELENHLIFKGQWDNAKKIIEEAGLA